MRSVQPHFLLFSGVEPTGRPGGRWHFLLESLDGDTVVEASDEEAGLKGERLELLALVRGLEALDQPSRVTLITASRDVRRGIRYGLEEWRANHWCWERDGRWVPIKNRDLWQRVDRALRFHRVDCRRWRLDDRHSGLADREFEPRTVAPAAGRVTTSEDRAGLAAAMSVSPSFSPSSATASVASVVSPVNAAGGGAREMHAAVTAVAADGWSSRMEASARQDAGDRRGGTRWWQAFARLFRSQESDWTWASAN
jgi:ribonuclease HI